MTQSTRRFYLSSDETLQATTSKPLSYVDWLKYEPTFDRSTAFEQYTSYLTQWYSNKGINSADMQQQYVRNIYLELLKQISIEYSTVDEQRFLKHIDLESGNDIDIALPFFAKKIKQIAIYYAEQRDEIKTSPLKANLKGSSFGLNQLLYKQIADIINNDPTILTQLSNLSLTVPEVLKNLQIDTVELYDTVQEYYNIDPTRKTDSTVGLTRSKMFNSNLLPDMSETFIPDLLENAIVELIKEVPVKLQSGIIQIDSTGEKELRTNEDMALAITDIVTGTELDRLDDSMFVNYMQTGELNLLNNKLAFQTYSGTDYYYLSSGETTNDVVSGRLFNAKKPHKELLNKFHPTIAAIPGEETFSQEYIGNFFNLNNVGLITYTTLDFQYDWDIEPGKIYTFPDPDSGASGYFGGSAYNKTPIIYYENTHWHRNGIVTHYGTGTQKQYKNIIRHVPYQSSSDTNYSECGVYRRNDIFDFWSKNGRNVWENQDIYPLNDKKEQQIDSRSDTLNHENKIIYRNKTDIYGNNYILVKYGTKEQLTPPINTNQTIYDTQYIEQPTESKTFPGKKMSQTDQHSLTGELFLRTIADTGPKTITSDELSSIYIKYSTSGILKFQQGDIIINDVYNELLSELIDIDIIHDIIIFHTTNYIVFEKIVYDYSTGIISSDQKSYSVMKKVWHSKDFEKSSNTWYDEQKNRILICKTCIHPTLSGSTDKMIYPEIYSYDINKTFLKQVYPDPDYTVEQLEYETGQFSLSSVNVVDSTEVIKVQSPRLTYNKDSELYDLFYLGYDINENVSLPRVKFRLYDSIINDIEAKVYRNKYNSYSMNPCNDTSYDSTFRENNPTITSQSWFHDKVRNLMFMSSTDNNGDPQPVSNSSCVWTYGSLPQSYASERDIVIGFDFLMSGTLSDPSQKPDGISVCIYRSRVVDQILPYPGAVAPAYESLDDGGLGPAFSYLDDKTRGSLTYNELDGLDSGHACVVLNTGGKLGNQNVSPNSITTYGPFLGTNIYSNTISLDGTGYNLYTQLVSNKDYSEHEFTRCRITLSNLARAIHIDLKNISNENKFTRVGTVDISNFFPDDYETPDRLKISLTSNTSTNNTGVVAIKNITTTGLGNVTRV